MGVVPLFFIIDVSHSCWNLIKLGLKIFDNYKINKHLSNLPDYVTADGIDKKEEITCYICFDELKVGKRLNCGHSFHLRCIKEWVHSSAGCPLCKVPVTSDKKLNKRQNEELQAGNFNIDQDRREGNQYINNRNGYNEDQSGDSNNINLTGKANQMLAKIHPDLKKLKIYQEITKIALLYDVNSAKTSSSSGAVSYSLPTEAVYNRSVKNEIKRLEIENYNRKILELYENPKQAVERCSNNSNNNRNNSK